MGVEIMESVDNYTLIFFFMICPVEIIDPKSVFFISFCVVLDNYIVFFKLVINWYC
jgi:hypothetical protein